MQLIVTQFPQHTWQAWRDRYLKQLRPLEANGDGENTPQSSPTRSNSQQKSPAQDSQHKEVKIELQASSPGHPQPLQRGRNTSVESHGSESEDNRNEANPKSLQQPGANRIQSQSPSHSSESDHAVMPSTEAISQSQGFIIGKREDFYEYLRDFRASETQTVDEELNTRPKIQGRHFELWDLWVAVQSQKVEAAERDWLRIAEDIGYNWTKLPTAPEQIMQFYDSYLGEFERLMLRYGGSESEDHAEEDDPIIETPQPLLVRLPASRNVASDGRFDSSPPKQPSLKRPHRSALSSDIGYPDASRKRSRLDPNSEIPSTPDDKNGTLHLRRPVSAGASPSDLQRLVLPKSSQLVRNNVKGKQVEVNSKEMQEEIPETQESHIETQVLTGFPEDTQNDVTPSQQLRSDIDAEERRQTLNRVSPTPRRKVVKSPFLLDEDDGEVLVPQPRYGQGPNSLLSQPKLQVPRRRSPPASLLKAAKDLTPLRQHVGKATPVPTSAHSTQQQRPVERLQPSSKPRSKAEELAEIVEYWMSLGYSQDIARRSLEATTWEPGLAGRIMQMLRDGQSIPANWEGVWTARDDEGLRLIDVVATPIDEKEARKRRKAADRLKDKHGEERMSLRRKWLTVKAEL